MKQLVNLIFLLLFIDLLFQQCANPRSPTGGPKDTIPPTLISSYPENGTVNFNEQELELEFTEFITAEKLQQKLIITPKTDVTYKSIAKRNKLVIKFNEPFSDSTTFNLNFSDGVTDITEKNPAINLSLAFSTGTYIDSMSISGNIIDLFTQEPASGYTVALYPFSDSLDYFTDFPLYFATTNDSGNFKLQYLKIGEYRLLSFNDDNRNILLDPETEAHGFIAEDLILDSATTLDKSIPTVLQNVKPLAFINARPAGPYVEIKYNKTINEYSIIPDSLYHNTIGDNKDAIRVYKPSYINYGDSLELIVSSKDSLDNHLIDTAKVVFLESNRKPSSFSMGVKSSSSYLANDNVIVYSFNKPVLAIDTSKFIFYRDSTFEYNIKTALEWNHNRTRLRLQTDLIKDSLNSSFQRSIPEDTTSTDSISTPKEPAKLNSIDFNTLAGAFISIENDTSKFKSLTIPVNESSSYGTIKFTLQTQYESFTLQLLDKSDKILYQSKNEKIFTFPKVKAGNYTIRVLIDTNNDGVWSPGNLLLNQVPEDLYLHPDELSVRENWVIETDLSF